MILFTVPCVPVAQPRQRHRLMKTADGRQFLGNYTPRNSPAQTFKATVRLAAEQAHQGPPLEGPLGVRLVFAMPRPGRLMWKSRPMPRAWHETAPDAENLAKGALDAMTGLVWRDDKQVA